MRFWAQLVGRRRRLVRELGREALRNFGRRRRRVLDLEGCASAPPLCWRASPAAWKCRRKGLRTSRRGCAPSRCCTPSTLGAGGRRRDGVLRPHVRLARLVGVGAAGPASLTVRRVGASGSKAGCKHPSFAFRASCACAPPCASWSGCANARRRSRRSRPPRAASRRAIQYVKLDALYLAFRHYRLRARVAKRARDRRRQARRRRRCRPDGAATTSRKPSPLRGVRYGSAPWSVQIVPVNQPGVSALEEPSGWATGWEWLDTLDAGEREWLLRALWFNCDEVRIARMRGSPHAAATAPTRTAACSRRTHLPPQARVPDGTDPPRRGGARGERHADRRVRRDRAHAAAAARYGGA